MIFIGDDPLWHLLKIYSNYGLRDFIICCGYKGEVIKRYFYEQYTSSRDYTIDYKTGNITYHSAIEEDWRITFVDTGLETMTGGRLAKIRKYVGDDAFCMTYGDGLANIDITKLVKFHSQQGRQVTVTAVKPPNRFGVLTLGENNSCTSFAEKPLDAADWINGGFFVINPKALDLIEDYNISWEHEPLSILASQSQLSAYTTDFGSQWIHSETKFI